MSRRWLTTVLSGTVVLPLLLAAGTAVAPSAAAAGPTVPRTSSATSSSGALVDGNVARGRTGAEWTAAAGDASPWVELSWSRPRRLASVQVFGPTATAV